LTRTLPDGASTTTYSYAGNTTTVTDPAGISKTFTSDVSGNLTSVLEPNPAGGTFTTSYTYDWMNHLIGSSMTRGSTTQTRTFVYNNAGQLTSATNPETGTVTYTYSADTTLWGKTDANGQLTVYGYDASKRVTSVHVYPYGWSYGEDPCQLVTYGYDAAGTNGQGRLTSTQYGALQPASTAYMVSGGCATASPYAFQELYTYHPAGAITGKTFAVTANVSAWYESTTQSLSVGYTYDSAGRLLTESYPQNTANATYTYGYDGMGRPVSMTDNLVNSYTGTGNVWVQNGQYDPAGHVTSLGLLNNAPGTAPAYTTQTMAYNANGQVTSMNWATGWGSSGLVYAYSATQNNGQITQMTDNISGETVSYSYDALKRLISASSTPISGSVPAAWTQAFGYDGFGNMTSKTLNGGGNSAPAVDPTTNRLTSGYDANGNMLTGYGLTMTYDGRNRAASASQMGGTEYYGYAPDNKRIYRWNAAAGTEEFTLYGAQGERLGTFAWATPGSPQYGFVPTETNVWFGKKLINRWVVYGGVGPLAVMRDRLGTDRETGARYYPYGDEITSTANDAEKYGTYVRDSFTTLDYADQRYYASSYGRFNTADPYGGSAHPKNPLTWNRYSYVAGDPVNRNDRHGLCMVDTTNGQYYGTYEDWLEAIYQNSNGAMSSDTTYSDGNPCSADEDGSGGGLQVFAGNLGNCSGASSCMAFAGGTGDNTGFGTSTIDPNCAPQQIVGAVIESDAATAGLNLNGLTATVQMVGTPCSSFSLECVNGMWNMTELDLTGDTSALASSIASSSFSCLGSNPIGSLFIGTPHPGYLGNCRQTGLTNSLQVNFNSAGAQIDIDPFNPSSVPPIGTILHGIFQVLPNLLSGSDTNYSTVAGVLGISVSCQ
jgi:RHS repeat-associated protein